MLSAVSIFSLRNRESLSRFVNQFLSKLPCWRSSRENANKSLGNVHRAESKPLLSTDVRWTVLPPPSYLSCRYLFKYSAFALSTSYTFIQYQMDCVKQSVLKCDQNQYFNWIVTGRLVPDTSWRDDLIRAGGVFSISYFGLEQPAIQTSRAVLAQMYSQLCKCMRMVHNMLWREYYICVCVKFCALCDGCIVWPSKSNWRCYDSEQLLCTVPF